SIFSMNGCSSTVISRLSEVYPDGLGREVLFDVFGTALFAVPAHLRTTERHSRVERVIRVDPDGAGTQAVRNAVSPADIRCEDPGGQPVRGGVRTRYRIVGIGEPHRGDDRSEDLLSDHLHIVT